MTGGQVRVALFTRNLRVNDNPMLAAAAEARQVIPLFVRDDGIAGLGFNNPQRQRFLDASLADLDHSLRVRGGALVVRDAVTTVQPAGAITPNARDHFAVFTPYFRRWIHTARRPQAPTPARLTLPRGLTPKPVTAKESASGWDGGEAAARKRVETWMTDGIERYVDRHDMLGARKAIMSAAGYLNSPTSTIARQCINPGDSTRCSGAHCDTRRR